MSVEHMAMVFAADGMDGSEKLLMLAYTNFTDAHGYCWPGEDRLAAMTGTSVSTVRRTKKKLMSKNLVKSARRAETSNLTRVNLALLASLARPRKDFDDNEVERLSFGKPPVEGSDTGPDLVTVQSDLSPSQVSDLQTVQSDLDYRSDCSDGQVNLTCSTVQSDTQSISEPSVDPSDSSQTSDGRSPKTSGSRERASGGSAASGKTKPSPLTAREKNLYAGVLEALPPELAALVPKNAPRDLKRAVVDALDADGPAARTPQQLVEYRLMPKWNKHYSSRDQAGTLLRPVGVLRAMLKRDAECGDPRCDERINVDFGEACTACAMRAVDRRADQKQAFEGPAGDGEGRSVPGPRTPDVLRT